MSLFEEFVIAAVDGIDAAAEKEVQTLRILRRPVSLGVVILYLAFADQHGSPAADRLVGNEIVWPGSCEFVGTALQPPAM